MVQSPDRRRQLEAAQVLKANANDDSGSKASWRLEIGTDRAEFEASSPILIPPAPVNYWKLLLARLILSAEVIGS